MKRVPTYEETGVDFAPRYWTPPTDGVVPATYDSAGLTAAIATAAGSTGSVIINSDITLASTVTLTSGVTLFSTNGSIVTGSGVIIAQGSQKIIGLRFSKTGSVVSIQLNSSSFTNSLVVACCEFNDGGIAISDPGASATNLHQFNIIERNRFINPQYSTYFQRVANSSVRYNWCENDASGRNIFFIGGRLNSVNYNVIRGGITGIALLAFTSLTGTGGNATMERFRIIGNDIRDVTEEGIGLDSNGNGLADMSTIDQFVLNSTLGTFDSSPRFVVPRINTFPANNLTRLYIIFLTGALRGRHLAITAQAVVSASTTISLTIANNSLTSAEFASVTNTDVLAVGYPFFNNLIENNYLSGTGEVGISLYGTCFRNRIRNNIINYTVGVPIRIRSLTGIGPSSVDSANRNDDLQNYSAPCSFNETMGNLIQTDTIQVDNGSYETLASGNNVFATYDETIVNNVCEDAVDIRPWRDINQVLMGGDVSSTTNVLTNSTDLTEITENGIPENSTLLNAGTHIGNRRDRRGYQRPKPPSIGPFDYATFVAIPS